ncbi:hypothetical protein BOVMAS03_14570 [Streptococcus uberis]|uniref:hypothetical protein n=1 Tax=Streptococcus uberis TaxID=1349 RepID=UPI003342BD1A
MIEVERQPKNTYSRIRCSNNIYDEIANIANECDLTLKEVTDALLNYGLAHAEIVSSEKIVTENKLIIGDFNNDSDN